MLPVRRFSRLIMPLCRSLGSRVAAHFFIRLIGWYTYPMAVFSDLDSSIVLSWSEFVSLNGTFGVLVRFIAVYGIYCIPLAWIVWWFLAGQRQREVLLSAIFAGFLAWQGLNRLVKLSFFHDRPIHTLPLKEILFERPENSFPSDHAAFLAGITCFFLLRGQRVSGLWLLGLTVIISLARVAVGAHYPSDIIVGWFDGFLIAWAINLLHMRLADRVWDKLIALARKLRLA
jgi:undecaprenyl-diphosphatase